MRSSIKRHPCCVRFTVSFSPDETTPLPPVPPRRSGMVAVARDIVRKEGVVSLWSGVGPACLRVGGGAALYFACLDQVDMFLKKQFKDVHRDSPVLSTLRTFTLGAVSRSFAAAVFCPITVVKTRMARQAAAAVLGCDFFARLLRFRSLY